MNEKEKEAIEKLTSNKKMTLIELLRKMKKEGIENFVVTRKEYVEIVLNLLENQDKLIHKMIDYIFDEDTSNFICKEMEKECDNNCSECYLKYFQEGLKND